MIPDPGLDVDHWVLVGYCDHGRLGSGCRSMYLRNCNGMEVSLYDCFGHSWKVKRSSFKIKNLQARGIDIPFSFDSQGWLCANLSIGGQVKICPWEFYNTKDKINLNSDVLLPIDDNFQLSVPPPRAIRIAVGQI